MEVTELQQQGQMATLEPEPILTKTELQLLQHRAQMDPMEPQALAMLAKKFPFLPCHFLWLAEQLGLLVFLGMAAAVAAVVVFMTPLMASSLGLQGRTGVGQMRDLGAKRQPQIIAATEERLGVMGPVREAVLQREPANLRLQEMVAGAEVLAHTKAVAAAAAQIDRAVAAVVRLTLTIPFFQTLANPEQAGLQTHLCVQAVQVDHSPARSTSQRTLAETWQL